MIENKDKESRITAGGIENLVDLSKVEVVREGYGHIYEYFKEEEGKPEKSLRRLSIYLEGDLRIEEESYKSIEKTIDIYPCIKDLGEFLKEEGLLLTNARIQPQLGTEIILKEEGKDSRAYYIGLADVYRIKE